MAATAANEFGEFHLKHALQDRLQLTAVIGSREAANPDSELEVTNPSITKETAIGHVMLVG